MTGTSVASRAWPRLRFVLSWAAALGLVAVGLPRAVNVSWHGVVPVLSSLHWPAAVVLLGIWLLGLLVHTFVLTAAAPGLTHRRALTLNMTGSAVANVVPLGGAAGIELNRRMMKAWGIDARGFAGYTFITNVWDIGAKLLLPVVAVVALAHGGEAVGPVRAASTIAGVAFVGFVALGALLTSTRGTVAVGRSIERLARPGLRLLRREGVPDVVGSLLELRGQCARLVATGWLRMSVGMAGYVALQCVLLGFCLHLTGGGVTWTEILAGFAVERLLTVIPVTPGGVGLADLGLVGVLIALGGDPAGVTAAAVLYRLFVFAVEIPVGGGALGLWLLGRRRASRRVTTPLVGDVRRVAHVTDVFLPRLGGIETHVDDLARHQRARGLDAQVFTPTAAGAGDDPAWVHRVRASEARRLVRGYDVVHVHLSMVSPFGIAVARAAMAAGVPTLVTVHSMWAGAGALLRLAAFASLRRWPVAWSAVSDAAAETFRRSLRRTDVAVLPNALDVGSWRPSDPPSADGPVTIISVMRLAPRKRPLQLQRTFEQVLRLTPRHDVRLVIVGDGRLRGRMERAIRRRGLADRVRITGRLPREQVLDELRAASVYVSPAPRESFGLAALEARCAGLPVVASRRGGVGEFVRDRQDGLLVADDAELAVAIAELVVDTELRDRITEHNRRVAPRLDWSDALDRTDALYRTAVDRVGVPEVVPGLVAQPVSA